MTFLVTFNSLLTADRKNPKATLLKDKLGNSLNSINSFR